MQRDLVSETHRRPSQYGEPSVWTVGVIIVAFGCSIAVLWTAASILFRIVVGSLRLVGILALAVVVFDGDRPAVAQARPPVTVAQGLSLLAALRGLDGRTVVAKQNGQDVMVNVPWEFGSGTLRIRIAQNIALMVENEKLANDARVAIIKEIVKGMPLDKDGNAATSIPQGTPQFEEFLRQYQAALDEPANKSNAIARIKISDLKLDKNEIPVTVLSSLMPILDE